MHEILVYLRELNMASMMLRIVLAMIAGGLVGLEREWKGRPAGFRTYMLVALGSAITMMLSQYLNIMLYSSWSDTAELVGIRTDVSRFGAQVVSGVGFLGAGTIIVTRNHDVKGLTTAAGLWASACMGLAIGAGFYECVVVAFFIVVICMRLLPVIEDRIMEISRNANIQIDMDSIEYLRDVLSLMRRRGLTVNDVDIVRMHAGHLREVSATISFTMPRKTRHAEMLVELSKLKGIISIEEV